MVRFTSSALVATIALIFVALTPTAHAESDAALVGPFTRDTYPQALIDRPLTLPAGMVEGELGATYRSNSFKARYFFSRSRVLSGTTDDWDLDLGLRVGVTDRIQLEAGTAFSLDHVQRGDQMFDGRPVSSDLRPSLSSWRRVVPFRLSVLALDTDGVDTAVTLTLPFVAYASREFVSCGFRCTTRVRNGDGRVLPAIELAAPTRWRLTPWLWLRAGQNLFSVTTNEGTGRFNFDLGLGLQAHRLLAFTLDTRLASVTFDGSRNSTSETLCDRGTVDLAAVFSVLPGLDFVGNVVLPDFGRRFDDYVLRSAVRVRF